MSGSSAPVTLGQVTSLVSGLQSYLGGVEQTLETKVFDERLPMLGANLATAFAGGQTAVTAFRSYEQAVIGALQGISADSTVAQVQAVIDQAIAGSPFAGSVTVGLDTTGNLTVGFHSAAAEQFSAALDSRFGLPGLNFRTVGAAQTTLTYGLNVTATVGAANSFAISAPGGALSLGLAVTAPSFSSDASLGFTRFTASDAGSQVTGTFTLDTAGNATFTGNAALNVHLATDMGTATLPSIGANLNGSWSFNASTVDPTSAAGFGNVPTITLSNVTYDFGSVVDRFLAPLMTEINQVLAPIRPALDALNADMPFLKAVLGDNWKALDTSGSLNLQGQNAPDGKLSLLDFLNEPTGDPAATPAIVRLVDLLNVINNFALSFSGVTNSTTAAYDLGSFSVPGDVRNAALQISQAIPTLLGPAPDLNAFLSSLGGSYLNIDPATGKTQAQDIQNLLDNLQLSFPLLSNPALAAQMLLGGSADLFTMTAPPSFIGVGGFNTDGTVANTATILAVPIGVPPIPISLTPALSVALGATVGINVGYDTSGLQAFAAGNFQDPSLVANGIYFANPGPNTPILSLLAAMQLSLTASAPAVSITADGSIGGKISVALKNAGKTYVAPFLSTLQSNPLSLFNISGWVGGDVGVKVSVGPTDYSVRTPAFTLFSFGSPPTAGGLPRQTATWLNTGLSGSFDYAGNWIFATGTTNADGTPYFGDTTIGAGIIVTYDGVTANLTSLNIGAGSTLDLRHGTMNVDGTPGNAVNAGVGYASINAGTIQIDGTATLAFAGDMTNSGAILVGPSLVAGATASLPGVRVTGLLSLSGGGSVTTYGQAAWQAAGVNLASGFSLAGDAELWNIDNTVQGAGQFDLQVLNQGTFVANAAAPMVLNGPLINRGLLEAVAVGSNPLTATHGTLAIASSGTVDNGGGTIRAAFGALVTIAGGDTLLGGLLQTQGNSFAGFGTIATQGLVTLNGGTTGLTVDGTLQVQDAVSALGTIAGSGTLTVTGLIKGAAYAASPGGAVINAGSGWVVLQAATIQGGELDSGTAHAVLVSGGATLDGAAGLATVALNHAMILGSTAATLTVDGGIVTGPNGVYVESDGGTIVVGTTASDTAIFGNGVGSIGTLQLYGDPTTHGAAVITGQDASSVLVNNWTILGSGALGNGKLGISNTAQGVIAATGPLTLVVETGRQGTPSGPNKLVNAGLVEALGGSLWLRNNIITNIGGTIAAASGTVALTNSVIDGGLLTAGTGQFDVQGGNVLEGVSSTLTLDAGLAVVVKPAITLTIERALRNRGTIQVGGPAGSNAALAVFDATALSGGGTVLLADASVTLFGTSVTTPSGFVVGALDNIDNTITGVGTIYHGWNVTNEAAGVIATGAGTLWMQAALTNLGRVLAGTGTLDISGNVANAGGTIDAGSGGVLIDGATLSGGLLTGVGGGQFLVTSAGGKLDGTTTSITIAAGIVAGLQASALTSSAQMTLAGAIVNHGTLIATASGTASLQATLLTLGSVALSGGGALRLSDRSGNGSSVAAQIIGQGSTANVLDNIDNAISGYGRIGYGETLINEAAGTIQAIGGVLALATQAYSGITTNRGQIGALGGTLDLGGVTDGTGGGSLAAMNDGAGHSGLVILDGTVRGGTLASDTTDAGSYLQTGTGTATTLDATAGAITLAIGANLLVGWNARPTLGGAFTNHGTVRVVANAAAPGASTANAPELLLVGTTTLRGGGAILLSDANGTSGNLAPRIVNALSAATLDNADNLISGYGYLTISGLTNEAAGTITAAGGTLAVSAPNGTIANTGILGASSGTLDLLSSIANAGGTIRASAGVALLDGITVAGGSFATSASGQVRAGLNGATLDGTANAVTIAAGGTVVAQGAPGSLYGVTLTVKGSFANHGTLLLDGSLAYSTVLGVAGTAIFTGGGTLLLSDPAAALGYTDAWIQSAAAGGTLDNRDNLITGNGAIGGNSTFTVINEAGGTIASGNRVLSVGWMIHNTGLVEAATGTLDITNGGIANAGGTVSVDGGLVMLEGATIAGGLLRGSAGGRVLGFSNATLDGSASAITIAAGAMVGVQAGVASGSSGMVALGSIVNHGTLIAAGRQSTGTNAFLMMRGTVTLSGGGTVALSDVGGATNSANAQLTGATGSDLLDNVDNTIGGVGAIASGFGFTNEAAGTVQAAGGLLRLSYGGSTAATINHGMLRGDGGTLQVFGTIDGSAGGTIAAMNDGIGHSGTVLIDGILRGGTLATDLADTASVIRADATSTGTLDGSVSAVTLAAGGQVQIGLSSALTVRGTLVNHGTISLLADAAAPGGAGYYMPYLHMAGAVVLRGGGLLAMSDRTGVSDSLRARIDYATPGGSLDNVDNTISGYGIIGLTGLTNEATGTIAANGGVLTIGGTVANAGLIRSFAGTLDLSGEIAGAGSLQVDTGGVLLLSGTVDAQQSLRFAGSAASLRVASAAKLSAAIGGFSAGDTIDLTSLTHYAGDHADMLAGNLVRITRIDATTLDVQLDPTQTFTGATFAVTSDGVSGTNLTMASAACYRSGTLIRTDHGEMPIERLRIGTRVISAFGGTVPVIWLGHRRVDCRRHPDPEAVWPVRVVAGALAPGAPARDLWLSPDHSVYVAGVLIPIRYLVNDATIRQEPMDEVTYWHVELPQHDVVFAEGAMAESYLDTGNRGAFIECDGAVQMTPDFARGVWAAQACADLVTAGPELSALHARLLSRAVGLGYTLDDSDDLIVEADGVVLTARRDGASLVIALPVGAQLVTLHSKSFVPANLGAGPDRRRLGVAVARLTLDGIAAPTARFGSGWHAQEKGLRWTDGAGTLDVRGAGIMKVLLADGGARYWRGKNDATIRSYRMQLESTKLMCRTQIPFRDAS